MKLSKQWDNSRVNVKRAKLNQIRQSKILGQYVYKIFVLVKQFIFVAVR